MNAIVHALQYQYMGAAVWVWLLTLVCLPVLNELVNRSRKVTAGSLLQAVGNAVRASKLYGVPLIKQFADATATPRNMVTLPESAVEAIKVDP